MQDDRQDSDPVSDPDILPAETIEGSSLKRIRFFKRAVVGVLLAVGWTATQPRVYEARSTVVVETNLPQVLGAEAVLQYLQDAHQQDQASHLQEQASGVGGAARGRLDHHHRVLGRGRAELGGRRGALTGRLVIVVHGFADRATPREGENRASRCPHRGASPADAPAVR